jgi:hypothetical protein
MTAFTAPVLGIPVTITSDLPPVLPLAETSFGVWNVLARRPELIEPADVRVAITANPALSAAATTADVHYTRESGTRLVFSGACAGWADRATGRAELRVSAQLVAHTEAFRYLVLEAAVLFLVTSPARFPVHAAAVAANGTAVLLAGRSGSGKSTLACAAQLAGWAPVSDDIVYVQTAPLWRVWAGGSAGARSYLDPGAARFFPGLAGAATVQTGAGRRKIVVPSPQGSGPAVPPVFERAALVVLERGSAARLAQLSPDDAHAALRGSPEPGFDVFPDMADAAVAPLTRRAWRLTLGAHPADAVTLLHRVVRG